MDWTPPELMEELSITDPAPPNCLEHGFAVHTKYELAPPFPSFSPKHSLAKDGVAVLNTGDSIIALAVSVGEEKSRCASLYSPFNSRSSGSLTQRLGDSSSQSTQNMSQEKDCDSTLTRTCATQTDLMSTRENAQKSCDINRPTPISHSVSSSMQVTRQSCSHSSSRHFEDRPSTSGQDLLSLCDSPDFCSQEDSVGQQEWPFSQDSQNETLQETTDVQRHEPATIDQLAMMGYGKSFTASVPEIRFNLKLRRDVDDDRTLTSTDEEENTRLEQQSIHITDAYDEVQSRSKRQRKCAGASYTTNRQLSCACDENGRSRTRDVDSQTSTKSVGTSPMYGTNYNLSFTLGGGVGGLNSAEERKTHDWSRVEEHQRSWFRDHDDSLIGKCKMFCDPVSVIPYLYMQSTCQNL